MSAISAVAPPLMTGSSSSRIGPASEAFICSGRATACWLAHCAGSIASRMAARHASPANRGRGSCCGRAARGFWLAHRRETPDPIRPLLAVPPGSGAARSCTLAMAWVQDTCRHSPGNGTSSPGKLKAKLTDRRDYSDCAASCKHVFHPSVCHADERVTRGGRERVSVPERRR
jgi:hypothetical protein